MLIRIVSHPKNNKLHIDKFIVIEGIPDHLLFETRGGRKVVRGFLGLDIEENIPKDILKEFCDSDEKLVRYIAPFEKGADPVFFERDMTGIVIDYQNRQGSDLWTKLERMIDDQTPRDRKVPEPVVVAKDHRSGFTITAEDVPVIKLTGFSEEAVEPKKKLGRPRKDAVAA